MNNSFPFGSYDSSYYTVKPCILIMNLHC